MIASANSDHRSGADFVLMRMDALPKACFFIDYLTGFIQPGSG